MRLPDHSTGSPRVALVAASLAYLCALAFNGVGSNLVLLLAATALALGWTVLLFWQDFRDAHLRLPDGWVPRLMGCFLLWLLASSGWSTYPYISQQYVWIIGAMPLWCLLWLKTPAHSWRPLWVAMVVIQTGLLVWGLYDYLALRTRASGPLMDSNAYGALVNAFFFPLLFRLTGLSRETPLKTRLAYGGLLVLSIFALFASYSRGAYLAWILLMIPAAGVMLLRRPRLALGIATLVGGAIIIGAAMTWSYRNATALDRPSMFNPNDPAIQHRLRMNRSAWAIYLDHPWLGTGLSTFKHVYPAYRDPREVDSAGYHAHNDYLEFLHEGGPVLLLFLLLCGWAALRSAWLAAREILRGGGEAGARAHENLGLALGVAALFIQAGVNFIFYVLPHTIIAGLFIGQMWKHRVTAEVVVPLRRWRPVAVVLLVVLLVIPLWQLSLATASAMVLEGQATLPPLRQIREDPQRRFRFTQRMAKLLPGNARPHLMLAMLHHAHAIRGSYGQPLVFARAARNHYLDALEALPVSSRAYLGLATLLRDYPELAADMPAGVGNDREILLKLAIHHAPATTTAYLELADLYETRGDVEQAYAVLSSARKWLGTRVQEAPMRSQVRLLEYALALAQQLDRARDVVDVATQLQRLQPGNKRAAQVLNAAQPAAESPSP